MDLGGINRTIFQTNLGDALALLMNGRYIKRLVFVAILLRNTSSLSLGRGLG